jgi:murein DD-endopeptidase MepM/ murein hydrolase activator NlpD
MKRAASRIACLALALLWAHGAPAQVLYRLPWPEGRSFIFGQAPGGMITTHATRDSLYAVDIPMPEGTPVLAARAGVVVQAEWRNGIVRVRHEDGTIATYVHFMHAGVVVEEGEQAEAGKLLGYSGTTGFSTGPHLHFGVTRLERAGETWEEVSVPVTFYVGDPPVTFAARAGLIATADYSPRAELPRAPRTSRRLVEWKPRTLAPEELPRALAELAVWLAAGLAGLAWFWRFSRN